MAYELNLLETRKTAGQNCSRKCAAFSFVILVTMCILMSFGFFDGTFVNTKYWVIQMQNSTFHPPSKTAMSRTSKVTATGQPLEVIMPTESPRYFQLVNSGTNVQVGDMQIHLTTAVHYDHYPNPDSFNVLLNGWARHDIDMNFTCCLLTSLDDGKTSALEVPSKVHNVYDQYGAWIVDMQSAEFSCSAPKRELRTNSKSKRFHYVTFSEQNCSKPPRTVLEIEYPRRIRNSVVICLKVSYGDLNLEETLEWFEYVKLIGTTRVVTFLSDDLSPGARAIFMYYNTTGFLDASPIDPAVSTYGTKRGFKRPRHEAQAFVDEVMACNDCKHRMSGHDYVIIQDLDEYVIPRRPHQTLLSILKTTSKRYPRAGAFSFDAHVSAKEWNETRSSPLHLMTKIHRTSFANYNDPGTDTRWAFMPHKVFYVRNNKAYPRKGYTWVKVPQNLFTLQHRRGCKREWTGCPNLSPRKKVRDTGILRFEARLITALRNLPLEELLPGSEHKDYINGIRAWTGNKGKQP